MNPGSQDSPFVNLGTDTLLVSQNSGSITKHLMLATYFMVEPSNNLDLYIKNALYFCHTGTAFVTFLGAKCKNNPEIWDKYIILKISSIYSVPVSIFT